MFEHHLAGVGDSLRSFGSGVEAFVSNLAAVSWGYLALGLALHGAFLGLYSRAWFRVIRAAYPAERVRWRNLWAAYMAGWGLNSVIPARAGDVARLYLARQSVPNSSYPALASSYLVEALFVSVAGLFVLGYALTQGVFPDLPDLPGLAVFDIGFLARNPDFALFALTALIVVALGLIAVLSVRVRAFWARTRQGLTILGDRRRYAREVVSLQLAGWFARFGSFWCLLEAFQIGASLRNTLLVMAVQSISTLVPFTPGGAGAQQALIAVVFGGVAGGSAVAAYAVGQQLSLAAFNVGVGMLGLALVFRTTDWRSLVRRGREDRTSDEPVRAT